MKRILAVIICLSMLLGMSVFAEGVVEPTVVIEGKIIDTGGLAYLDNGKVMVPLKPIVEAMDASLWWNPQIKSVAIKMKDKTAVARVGRKEVAVGGKVVVLDTPPMLRNNRTVVSLNFLNTVMGLDLSYDKKEHKVSLEEQQYVNPIEVTYSTGFSIDNLGNDIKKVVDGDGNKFLLVPKTAKVPDGYEGYQVVRTPIDRVFIASSTQACALNALDLTNSIAGVTTPADDWYIPKIKEGIEKGDIVYVGNSYAPDFELIEKIKPEIAFVYTGSYPQTTIIDKLEELNIPYVVNNEYMEATSLGRLEWMKFEAAFYNEDEKAKELFDQAVNEIQNLKTKVKTLDSPKVAWGSVYKGVVYVPNAGSYIGEMIASAGGEYVFKDLGKDQVGSAMLTLEEFYAQAVEADVLIYSSSYVSSIEEVVDAAPILEDLEVIQSGEVYTYHPSWYQTIDMTADKYVDLANILFPEKVDKTGTSENYIKIK